MRIAIDVSLLKINLAGMGIYVKEMVELFGKEDESNEYFLFTNSELKTKLDIPQNFHIVKCGVKPHIIWLQVAVPILIRKYRIDVFWQPDHILPIYGIKCRQYVTIHDLSAYKLHNVAMKRVELVYRLFMKKTCQRATKVITISNYTKSDILNTLNVPDEKVIVIYNGDSPYRAENVFSNEQIKTCFDKYGIHKPYYLFVGTINPRKNIATLIKAFDEVKKSYEEDQLVIAGEYGWNSDDVKMLIENSIYKKDIIKTGYVSELEKEILYRNANAFVFPSILEGFGLPVLEAMSIGIPVISSNVSSMPEVGGDSILYYSDPYNFIDLADKMRKVRSMGHEELVRIKEKEISQSLLFNRRDCARKTLEIFGALLPDEVE